MQAKILDQKLKSLVQTERKITYDILLLIQTIDLAQSYREFACSSLYEYLTKEIGYSEGAAQRRISSARLLKEIPSVAEDLKAGILNLSQMAMVRSAVRQEEKAQSQKISADRKSEILGKIKSKSGFDSKKILMDELPKFEVPTPQVQPARENRVHLTLSLREEEWESVKNLMAHFSHSVPDQKVESLLLFWCQEVARKKAKALTRLANAKKQPSEQSNEGESLEAKLNKVKPDKAKLNEAKPNKVKPDKAKSTETELYQESIKLALGNIDKTSRENVGEISTENISKTYTEHGGKTPPGNISNTQARIVGRTQREYISKAIKYQVYKKADSQCEFVSRITGQRCCSKHFLQIDHIVPIAMSGTSELNNLRLLCQSHNLLSAKQWGISKERDLNSRTQ